MWKSASLVFILVFHSSVEQTVGQRIPNKAGTMEESPCTEALREAYGVKSDILGAPVNQTACSNHSREICSGINGTFPTGMFPYPDVDCRAYIKCENWTAEVWLCPPQEIFDTTEQECTEPKFKRSDWDSQCQKFVVLPSLHTELNTLEEERPQLQPAASRVHISTTVASSTVLTITSSSLPTASPLTVTLNFRIQSKSSKLRSSRQNTTTIAAVSDPQARNESNDNSLEKVLVRNLAAKPSVILVLSNGTEEKIVAGITSTIQTISQFTLQPPPNIFQQPEGQPAANDTEPPPTTTIEPKLYGRYRLPGTLLRLRVKSTPDVA